MNLQAKLAVCLFSDANFLAVNILENLLSKNCIVNVITDDVAGWKESTLRLSSRNKFSINDRKNLNRAIPSDYAIFCGGFIDSRTAYTDYAKFISIPAIAGAKTLTLFPFEIFDKSGVESLMIPGNTALVLVGDLLGPRINLNSNLLMPRVLAEIISKRNLTVGVGEEFYPIFISDAVKVIVKWLFSFGPFGKTILLLGSRTSSDIFWQSNQNLVGKIKLKYNPKIVARTIPKSLPVETVQGSLNFSLTETYSWLSRNNFQYSTTSKKIISSAGARTKIKTKMPKTVKTSLMLLLLLFTFPFLTLLVNFMITFGAYKSFMAGNDSFAQSSLLLAQTFAVVSEKVSVVLINIPGVGLVYKETGFAASFAEQTDDIAMHAIPVIKDAAQLFGNILGSQVYDSTNLSQKIESELGLLSNDAISIKSFTTNASLNNVILAKKLSSKIDFEKFVGLVSGCRVLAGNIPSLLGQNQGKTYLVLFENNMELRPTGGFIGSFGLLSFDGGRLTDLAVNDVYSADGQLNGHVEPPAPIKNYLNEANWWLRDSNWDPDFPTSAKRAEWFLDKELGKKVDGVAAVDLSPIKGLLKITGPIFLADYNLSITSDNLYEETQNEVQNNFFPGTHKKASFITALTRSLLDKVAKLEMNQMLAVLKSFYGSLNQRHIQAYLHDSVSQQAISELQWDGSVSLPTCGSDCYADLIGVVEANVGDNKANYFIQRDLNISVGVGKDQINHTMVINFQNNANPKLGPSGKYKTYIRLLMPEDSVLISVKSLTGVNQENLSPEITDVRGHKEVGVLIDILGGGTKKVEFSWSTDVSTSMPLSSYGLYFRKQAGTEADPIRINIRGGGGQIRPDPRFTLTREGTYVYNTTLVQDLFSLFSW